MIKKLKENFIAVLVGTTAYIGLLKMIFNIGLRLGS